MKNFKERLKIIVTAVVCFLMNIFPKRNGEKIIRKYVRTKKQPVNNFSDEIAVCGNHGCREESVFKEVLNCKNVNSKNTINKINVISKYQVYWHVLLDEIQSNPLEYYASG